ncbi:hypothetical protein [Rhizobium sp. C4]|uniref:hypothetical protein n=1 Tax=Rhizobium sp. C4 TaxID=1349800 RepID=UPI001E5A01B5|nr:hypothetical protein [Rhizobium sp. C4]MCD2173656.1 hypothetical protein [Rhizobium sp. C4]
MLSDGAAQSRKRFDSMIGDVAGTVISAQALVINVAGSILFIAFAAIMIAFPSDVPLKLCLDTKLVIALK